MSPIPQPASAAWHKVTELPCARGEHPFWHPQEERLYWADTATHQLWRLHVPSGKTEHWELGQALGGMAPCRSARLLLTLRDGIYLSTTWHDIPQKLTDAPFPPGTQRFSEGRCDPWGRFWVGTTSCGMGPARGALYCLHTLNKQHPDLHKVDEGLADYRGLAWTPDGKTLYHADPARHVIGTLTQTQPGQWPPLPDVGAPLAHFPTPPAGGALDQAHGGHYGGRPGGGALDSAGRYWVAMEEGARVLCLNPQGGTVAELATPAQCPTALCFGGDDLRTLYLTTARAQRGAAELAHYPDSGAVFALRVDVPGLPVEHYWD